MITTGLSVKQLAVVCVTSDGKTRTARLTDHQAKKVLGYVRQLCGGTLLLTKDEFILAPRRGDAEEG